MWNGKWKRKWKDVEMGWLVNLRNGLKLSSLTHFWANRKAIRISPQTFGPPSQLLFVFTQFVKSLESSLHTGEKYATGRNATGNINSITHENFFAQNLSFYHISDPLTCCHLIQNMKIGSVRSPNTTPNWTSQILIVCTLNGFDVSILFLTINQNNPETVSTI